MAARTTAHSEEAALSLSLAMVAAAPGPLLLLDGNLNIVAISPSFCEAFEIDPGRAEGTSLFDLGNGEWDVVELRDLLGATVAGGAKIEAYEMDLERDGRGSRRLVIHAARLVQLDLEHRRLLVAVADVTDAREDTRLKDEALRQTRVLLLEVRHRVANSLQIVASLLLQSARQTSSEEARGDLRNAHRRVMSVAALERQLAGVGNSDVELHAYFTTLFDNIAASMVSESGRVSLVVAGSSSFVGSRVSLSLGLIVTELVINALKHAFPGDSRGQITVDWDIRGPNWTLSVVDDGIGMQAASRPDGGLGTTIVYALAKQLNASVEIRPGYPGTHALISHTQVALVADDEGSVPQSRHSEASEGNGS